MRASGLGEWGVGIGGVLLLAGCASPGVPRPPSLQLPEKATDVRAQRVGDSVEISWTMAADTTDGDRIQGAVTAVICRSVSARECVPLMQQAGVAGPQHALERLGAADRTGAARLWEYHVELKNGRGRSAGLSQAAYAAGGAALEPPMNFQATPTRAGVELRWKAGTTADGTVQVSRLANKPEGPPIVLVAGSAPASGPAGDMGGMLDRSVQEGMAYRYVAERVRTVTLSGRAVELRSAPAPVAIVTYRNSFPPKVPGGLVTIPGGGYGQPLVIDLSWEPDSETGIAGYNVFRGVDGEPEVLLTAKPVTGAAYRDAQVAAGHRYSYRVTAVDAHGNESARSAAASETARR